MKKGATNYRASSNIVVASWFINRTQEIIKQNSQITPGTQQFEEVEDRQGKNPKSSWNIYKSLMHKKGINICSSHPFKYQYFFRMM